MLDLANKQLGNMQTINGRLDGFIANVSDNNNNVVKALETIEGGHKTVIDNIMADCKEIFKGYSTTIEQLNEKQRQLFITAIITSMKSQSKEIENKADRTR